MNKKLLTSVSLLALLASSHASAMYEVYKANDLKITLGADVNLQAGMRFQSSSKNRINSGLLGGTPFVSGPLIRQGPSNNNTDLASVTSASAFLGAENKTKSDIKYGIQVGLFTTTNGDFPSKDHLGRTYAYFERNDFGRFELGTKKGASTSMALDGDDVTAGTGAFNGDWNHYVHFNSFTPGSNYSVPAVNFMNFADDTKLIIKDTASDSSNDEGARKITYYTPKHKGLQFGLSFVPDVANRGGNQETTASPFTVTGPNGNFKNAFMASASYEYKIDEKQKIKVVLVGETGRYVRSYQDMAVSNKFPSQPFAFDIGAQYDYDKFSIAGSFGDKGKFKYPNNQPGGVKSTIFYTLGLGYQFTEKIKASFAYFHSYNRNTLDIFSLGAHYNWLSGVQPYAELNYLVAHQKWNYRQSAISTTGSNLPKSLVSAITGMKQGPLKARNQGAALITGIRFDF